MSAGSGVVHSETVDAASGPTRFIQTWVLPDEPGGATTYSSAAAELAGEWLPVVSGSHPDAATRISASGATLYARSEEHTSELQSLMRISYAVFCLNKKKTKTRNRRT